MHRREEERYHREGMHGSHGASLGMVAHLRVVGAVDVERSRVDARSEDDEIVASVDERTRVHALPEALHHAACVQLIAEVSQRLVEFFFPRHALGEVELTADGVRLVVQRHLKNCTEITPRSRRDRATLTVCPRAAATVENARPAGPAPTTPIARADDVGE